VLAALVKSLTT